MIRSFADKQTESVWNGMWNGVPSIGFAWVDECFIDLRIIDSASVEADLAVSFGTRLTVARRTKSTTKYRLTSEIDQRGGYSLSFVWSSGNVDGVGLEARKGIGGTNGDERNTAALHAATS